MDAIWFNQGQVCCAGSRILVQEGVADRLVAKLKARMETLRLGDPLDKAVDMGAIVAPVQLERIEGLVRRGAGGGGHDVAALLELPPRRLVLPADALHRRLPRGDHRAGGDLRAGGRADDASARRPKRWSWRTTPATDSRPASGPRTSTSPSTSRRSSRRGRSGSTAPTSSTRRAGSAGIGRAGSDGKAGGRGCGSM